MDTSIEMTKLTESTVVAAADHQTSVEVDGERVILGLEEGIYYGLNSTGAQIWEQVQEPTSVEKVAAAITAEYDVDREHCLNDVIRLLQELEDYDLITVQEQ